MEFIYELVSCLDPVAEAVCELYDCSVTVKETGYERSAYPVTATESAVNLSVLFVIVRSAPPWSSASP